MNISKKTLLLLILSMSFHVRTMCMEKPTESQLQALEVVRLVSSDNKPFDAVIMGIWLAKKRKEIVEEKWQAFVTDFVSDIDKCIALRGTEAQKPKLVAIRNVINDVASRLQQGQDCSLSLLNPIEAVLGSPKKSKL